MANESAEQKPKHCLTPGFLITLVHMQRLGLVNHDSFIRSFSEALKPLEEQQRLTNERLAKLQHGVEVMSYQQREQVGLQ